MLINLPETKVLFSTHADKSVGLWQISYHIYSFSMDGEPTIELVKIPYM